MPLPSPRDSAAIAIMILFLFKMYPSKCCLKTRKVNETERLPHCGSRPCLGSLYIKGVHWVVTASAALSIEYACIFISMLDDRPEALRLYSLYRRHCSRSYTMAVYRIERPRLLEKTPAASTTKVQVPFLKTMLFCLFYSIFAFKRVKNDRFACLNLACE